MRNLLVALIFMSLTACSVVGPGEKGVRVIRGKVSSETLDSGWYLWVPFITNVKSISVRVKKTETASEAASKDMQKVTARIAVNWNVNGEEVSHLYQTIGDEDDVVERIINPAVSEVLKAATAKMTAEEILTKRIELKKNIDESLAARLKTYNVIVNDVSLVDLEFTKEFNHAVESKQIEEQKAKQAEYAAVRADKEATAEINKARGVSEAQKLLKTTITQEILQQRAIEKWDGKFPQVMGSGALPFLNLKMDNK